MKGGIDYKKAGVDRDLGDLCSQIAYSYAKKTFAGRRGLIGSPLLAEGGFTGALDFGKFYIVQNEDGVGTKIAVAEKMGEFDTLGYDLVAMVADDAVCAGAEVVSISNTIDAASLSKNVVSELMKGLSRACLEQKIVIPGGEIAELKGHVNGYMWNATAVGIVEKNKFITGEKIEAGDTIIGIASPNFRSNGFTLLRAILQKTYGPKWNMKKFRGKRWGEIALAPSVIYHAAMLSLIGRFGERPRAAVKGIAHITGGGLPGNAPRMFGKQKLGLMLDKLPQASAAMKKLQKLGQISDKEAYETWNMGIGMAFIAENTEKALGLARRAGLKCSPIGKVTKEPAVVLKTSEEKYLKF